MKRIVVDGLPDEPLAASGLFHQHWLRHIENVLEDGKDVIIAFASADHTHRAWRRVAVQALARKYAPRRVVAVSGEGAILDALENYLTDALGVTGQYLEGADAGSGPLPRHEVE